MNMATNDMIQTMTMILGAAGILAFLVSAIVQTVKEMPVVLKIPTSAVAFTVSLILCPLALCGYCTWQEMPLTWYLLAASVAGAFPVYLIATSGWERLHEIWKRTRYNGKNEG